ncbi:MAG: TetR/AcrR family transcriptional regulator [Aromatoleum sp.]|jgi:AcrR family transcriptional regulator|uniref:TetR/AcrR family transcriptional regulator n=1 Tax=Aromatoleum sp. TaxID=2307007 RepID=UPI0028950A52|nr:TetR/AcrR family transcriptional regulator [Aromatoleum sp.]MDT3671598.1 TetR/AcrR family transcriptional regulator [Aromatoleum sp.]
MENMSIKPRVQLDRDAWVLAATDVLADDGIAGLRVEVLAKRLKVTKGSFYWHFQDRRDLLMAVLQTWRDGRIRDIVKQTRAQSGRELEQIYHVIDVYSASRSRRGAMIELAVRDWARRDPDAAAIVAEVDEMRLRCARELFLACGVPMDEASSRCMLLYAYVFGISLMIYDKFDSDVARLKRDIADLIALSTNMKDQSVRNAGTGR